MGNFGKHVKRPQAKLKWLAGVADNVFQTTKVFRMTRAKVRLALPRKIAGASSAACRRAAAPLTPCPRRAAPQWDKLHFAEREKFEAYKQWQRQKQRDRPLAAAPSGEGGSE